MLERTAATSIKKVNLALAGFDPSGVDVKRAPDVAGRIDFEVTPGRVKAGDPLHGQGVPHQRRRQAHPDQGDVRGHHA